MLPRIRHECLPSGVGTSKEKYVHDRTDVDASSLPRTCSHISPVTATGGKLFFVDQESYIRKIGDPQFLKAR